MRLHNITLAYGTLKILDDLNFELPAGSRTIITGENGVGKTSLIRIALGLLAPDSGSASIFGKKAGARSVRRYAAYVRQLSTQIDFPVSAREVVSIGTAGAAISAIRRKLIVEESMGQTDCLAISERPFRVLSGGERQRVEIARCLCQKPYLLVLDEPFASLDHASCNEVARVLNQLPDSIAVLLISHRLTTPFRTNANGLANPIVDEENQSADPELFASWDQLTLVNGRLV